MKFDIKLTAPAFVRANVDYRPLSAHETFSMTRKRRKGGSRQRGRFWGRLVSISCSLPLFSTLSFYAALSPTYTEKNDS